MSDPQSPDGPRPGGATGEQVEPGGRGPKPPTAILPMPSLDPPVEAPPPVPEVAPPAPVTDRDGEPEWISLALSGAGEAPRPVASQAVSTVDAPTQVLTRVPPVAPPLVHPGLADRIPLNQTAAGVYADRSVGAYPNHTAGGYAPPPPAVAPGHRASRRPGWPLVGAGLLGLALVAFLVTYLLTSPSETPAAANTGIPAAAPAGGYTLVTERTDPGCATRSYGEVRKFFAATDCESLTRALYTTRTSDGTLVVASVLTVTMPSAADADRLRTLVDTSNTGNVNDLLREGVRVPGGPDRLTQAGYASKRDDRVVTIVETDFADPDRSDPARLTELAGEALNARS